MNIDFTLTIACLIVRSILVEVWLCSEYVCFKEKYLLLGAMVLQHVHCL